MSFHAFSIITTVVNKDTIYFERVHDWQVKRESLQVQLQDLPAFVEAYKGRTITPHPDDSRMSFTDELPRIRLVIACEATTNIMYGLAEVAAQFGHIASGRVLPSSFNDLRKKVQSGKLSPDLTAALGDMQWYEKVRELRTEWAHYSSPFVAEEDGEPVLIVRAYRRVSDKIQFTKQLQCSIQELIHWTGSAIQTIDNYANYVACQFLLPKMDLDAPLTNAKRDKYGMPILKPDGLLEVEVITVREYFKKHGITITGK